MFFFGLFNGLFFNFFNWYFEDFGVSKLLMGIVIIFCVIVLIIVYIFNVFLLKLFGYVCLMLFSVLGYFVLFGSFFIIYNFWWVLLLEFLEGIIYGIVWFIVVIYLVDVIF